MHTSRSLPSWLRQILPAACLAVATLSSCSTLNLIPVSQDPILGAEAYPELLAGDATIASGADYQMVLRMTENLVAAAKTLDPDIANLFEWEVRLVDRSDLVNAWCLPGGKMAVYTGILPVAETETGLAVVMGHEIAHATLRHGTRKMTHQIGATAMVAIITLAYGDTAEDKALAAMLAGAAAAFVNLAYGRDAELEADARGLRYMAQAGYDPREAVAFWQRMQAASGGGGGTPEWLSTHPSNDTRIDQIRDLLPEAVEIYEQSRGSL
jgi:predicted Zn-dependent protease